MLDKKKIIKMLKDLEDPCTLDLENNDDEEENGDHLIEMQIIIPENKLREHGPELKDLLEEIIKTDPTELIGNLFHGELEEIEWDEDEKKHSSVFYSGNQLKIALNFCGRLR